MGLGFYPRLRTVVVSRVGLLQFVAAGFRFAFVYRGCRFGCGRYRHAFALPPCGIAAADEEP